jgi:secretion/DNA translocation related CpaE-like protein
VDASPLTSTGGSHELGDDMPECRPLVLVRDELLLDEVLRLAAAAACEVEVVPDPRAARASWARAPLVVLDDAALQECRRGQLPQRGGLVLACVGRPPQDCWQRAFEAGVEQVVSLPEEEGLLAGLLADVVDGPSAGGGRVLGVIGGRGGAGASVLAAAVAVEAARADGGALLVDCDQLAGGIDLLLGAEHDAGLRWPELGVHGGRVSMSALGSALPDLRCGPGRVVMLSCGRDGAGPTPDGVAAVIDAGVRAGHTVVCDLPRQLDAAGWQVVERADLVAVVVPAEVRASAAAMRVVERLSGRARRIGAVVRGPAPDSLSVDAVTDAVGVELLTVMRAEPRLAKDLERAEFGPKPSGPLAAGARAVLGALWLERAMAAVA